MLRCAAQSGSPVRLNTPLPILFANAIKVEIVTGAHRGERAFISRMPTNMQTDRGDQLPVSMSREQFPLRPAFAMTINKAQGQTLLCRARLQARLVRAVTSRGRATDCNVIAQLPRNPSNCASPPQQFFYETCLDFGVCWSYDHRPIIDHRPSSCRAFLSRLRYRTRRRVQTHVQPACRAHPCAALLRALGARTRHVRR